MKNMTREALNGKEVLRKKLHWLRMLLLSFMNSKKLYFST